MMDNIDKENNCVPGFIPRSHIGTPIHSKFLDGSMSCNMNKEYTRTPLQDINNRNTESGLGLGKAAKIVQYGQHTPLTVPTTKTKERKGKLQKMGILDFDASNGSAPDRLESKRTPHSQYRKMIGAFQHYKQDYEERLSSKDNYIKSLEEKLETNLNDSLSEMTNESTEKLKKECHNESTLQSRHNNSGSGNLPGQVESSKINMADALGTINTDSFGTGTSPHRTPIPLQKWSTSFIKDGTRRRSSIVSYASPSDETENDEGTRSIGCSPIKIPVEHLEAHSSSGEDMSPRDDQLLKGTGTKTVTSSLLETSKSSVIHKDEVISVFSHCISNEIFENAKNDDAGSSNNDKVAEVAESLKLMEMGVSTSVFAQNENEQDAIAFAPESICTNTEKKEFKECQVNTSFEKVSNIKTIHDKTEYTDSGINTSVNICDTVATNTESFETKNTSVNTSFMDASNICQSCSSKDGNSQHTVILTNLENEILIGNNNVSCNTSIIEYQNGETNTEFPCVSDISLNTSIIESSSIGVNTENNVLVDESINTSLTGSVVSEKESTSVGTDITPKKSNDVNVWTSPTCLYVARPSVIDGFTFKDEDLKIQLESASISNTLLREELHQTSAKQQEVFEELERVKEFNTDTESRIRRAEKNAKASFQDQIESLMVQQAGYLNEIAKLEKDLRNQVEEFKHNEERHTKQVTWLKEQNNILQSDLKLAYKQKKDEIKALEDKYSQDDYKKLYHRSQEELKKLKSQLQEFFELVNVLQDSQQTQVEAQKVLEVGLIKVKEVAEKNKLERSAFEEKVKSWQIEKEKVEQDTRLIQEQCTLIKKESEDVNKLLEQEKYKILKLEEQLRLDSEKLTVAEKTVEDISAVNKTMIQGLDEKDADIKKLENEKEALLAEIQELNAKIMSMTDLFEELKSDLTSFKSEVVELQEQKSELNGRLESLQKRYDSDTTVLQRTIDTREEETERLNKTNESLQSVCSKQKYLIESIRQQLSESQEKEKDLYILQDQIQALQQSSKESQEFMEQEHKMLEEENSIYEKKNQSLHANLENVSLEKDNLNMQLEEMSVKYEQIEAELDHVKTEAHMMLLQQVHEINSGSNAVSKLSERLHAMYKQLKLRSDKLLSDQVEVNIEVKDVVKNTESDSLSTNLTDGEKVRKSFLNSVLTAIIDDSDDLPQSNTSNSERTPVNDNLQPPISNVLGSSFSAFTKVQVKRTESLESEQVSLCEQGSTEDSSQNSISDACSIESDHNSSICASSKVEDGNDASLNENSGLEDEITLTSKVDSIYKLVGDIISLVKVLDNTFNESEETLRKKISSLEKQLEIEQLDKSRSLKGQDDKAASLQLQLIDAKQIEKQLRSDLSSARQQYVQSEQNLSCVRKMCEEKTSALEKIMDSQSDSLKLKQEVSKLQRALAQKNTECKIAQESLEDALLKLEEISQGKSSDMKYANENYLLKMEVNKLKHQLFKKKEEMDEVISKANSRNKTYEQNYNKATKEIVVLDNTIDNLRYLLRRHKDEVRTWPDAKEIWNEIVYDKRVDDSAMKWSS